MRQKKGLFYSLILIGASLLSISCSKKSNNNDILVNGNGRPYQYPGNPYCTTAGCTNTGGQLFAEAIGNTGQGMTEIEFGLALYADQVAPVNGSLVPNGGIQVTGYMNVIKDLSSVCKMPEDLYDIWTIQPGTAYNSAYFQNIKVEAVGRQYGVRVVFTWTSLGISGSPIVVSPIDQMQYNNAINGQIYLESIQSPFYGTCNQANPQIQVGGI